MQFKKQQLELYMEKWTGSKLGKEYIKAVYCHPAYLASMQIASLKCWTGWITSWNQDCREKYQQPQRGRWYHPSGRKQRGTKEPLDESERGEWKSWLKTQHAKSEDHSLWSHYFMANRIGKWWKQWETLFSRVPKSLWIVTAAIKLKTLPSWNKEVY